MNTDRRCILLHARPCGFFGDQVKPCNCSPGIVTKYQKRISGPLLDRIDIHIEVPRVESEKLSDQRLGEPSAVIQKRVGATRQRHLKRYNSETQQPTKGSQSKTAPVKVIASPIQLNTDMHPAYEEYPKEGSCFINHAI